MLFRVTLGFDLVPKHLGYKKKVPHICCLGLFWVCLGLFRVTVEFDLVPKHLGLKEKSGSPPCIV